MSLPVCLFGFDAICIPLCCSLCVYSPPHPTPLSPCSLLILFYNLNIAVQLCLIILEAEPDKPINVFLLPFSNESLFLLLYCTLTLYYKSKFWYVLLDMITSLLWSVNLFCCFLLDQQFTFKLSFLFHQHA